MAYAPPRHNGLRLRGKAKRKRGHGPGCQCKTGVFLRVAGASRNGPRCFAKAADAIARAATKLRDLLLVPLTGFPALGGTLKAIDRVTQAAREGRIGDLERLLPSVVRHHRFRQFGRLMKGVAIRTPVQPGMRGHALGSVMLTLMAPERIKIRKPVKVHEDDVEVELETMPVRRPGEKKRSWLRRVRRAANRNARRCAHAERKLRPQRAHTIVVRAGVPTHAVWRICLQGKTHTRPGLLSTNDMLQLRDDLVLTAAAVCPEAEISVDEDYVTIDLTVSLGEEAPPCQGPPTRKRR